MTTTTITAKTTENGKHTTIWEDFKPTYGLNDGNSDPGMLVGDGFHKRRHHGVAVGVEHFGNEASQVSGTRATGFLEVGEVVRYATLDGVGEGLEGVLLRDERV